MSSERASTDLSSKTIRQVAENSKVQMTAVVIGLIQGRAPKEISAEQQIPLSRITRWQRDDDFVQLYAEVEAEMMAQIRSEAADMIRARLDYLGPAAVAALEEGLASEKMSDRLASAKAILAFNGVGKTARAEATKVVSIEDRIRARAVDVSPASGD
jgi:hypothetical protein